MDASPRVNNNIHFVHLFAKADPKQLKALVDTITRNQLLAICEIILNYCAGTLKLPPSFGRRKDLFNTLADGQVTLTDKSEILQQSAIYRGVVQRLLKSFIS
jgi:hypothetical protein